MLIHQITFLRFERGLSESALARLAGVTQSAISYIEKSKKYPSLGTLQKLAKGLGLKTSELVEKLESQPWVEVDDNWLKRRSKSIPIKKAAKLLQVDESILADFLRNHKVSNTS